MASEDGAMAVAEDNDMAGTGRDGARPHEDHPLNRDVDLNVGPASVPAI